MLTDIHVCANPSCVHRTVPTPAQLPINDRDQATRQMQSLSLKPSQDSTAQESGPGTDMAVSTQEQHLHSQHSVYDPSRDSTAQPMSAWQNQHYTYYDPSAYQYDDYGEYYDEELHGLEAGDDWDQLGFAAESDSMQHRGDEQSQSALERKQASRRKPSEQALCSQYQVSGDCPRGAECHMAHGALCQVNDSQHCCPSIAARVAW